MSTGYAAKRGSTNRNAWGQQYGSHGQQNAGPAQMRLGVDFPYVCERCLGPNPYVQMIKQNFGAACKISQRPFHVFKWTNPQTSRRMKTIISYEAASVRNCCQACMSDMTYGVPLVVRDALLKAAGQTRADLPESEVGQSFFFSQREQEHQLVASGAVGVAAEADPRLQLENAHQVRSVCKVLVAQKVSESNDSRIHDSRIQCKGNLSRCKNITPFGKGHFTTLYQL